MTACMVCCLGHGVAELFDEAVRLARREQGWSTRTSNCRGSECVSMSPHLACSSADGDEEGQAPAAPATAGRAGGVP